MTKAEYEDYLRSPRWVAMSRDVRRFRRECEKCSFPYELNVHHRTYERLGHERMSDLIVLCRSCHARTHFLDDLDSMPEYLLLGSSKDGAKQRIKDQQKEAREKNLDRSHEIKTNKEKQEN